MCLPKSWRHWCKRAGLSPDTNARYARNWLGWMYLKGHGRRWRVNRHGMFQVSCSDDDFDRWANSLAAETAMPFCLAKMRAAVSLLIHNCHD